MGKDLSKSRKDDQLVKHKDIGLYLLLYISIDYEKYVKHPWGNNDEEMRKTWETLHYYIRCCGNYLVQDQIVSLE